jgi:ankyrin repeat protein
MSAAQGEPAGHKIAYSGNISAAGQARQHNGNIYNNYEYQYTLRKRHSDETLRENGRNIALFQAAAQGQTPRVRYLMHLGVNIDHYDDYGFTALHHAVLSGFEDVVGMILEAGADVNADSLDHGSPLCLAASKARERVVDILLEYRADVLRPYGKVGTPLHCACIGGSTTIVESLLKRGARLDSLATVHLDIWADFGQPSGIVGTAESVADPDDIGAAACQPLLLAALEGHLDVVEHLVNAGAVLKQNTRAYLKKHLPALTHVDSTVDGLTGFTVVMAAAARNRTSVLEWILSKTTEIDAVDSLGNTALMYAVRRNFETCTRILLEDGASPNQAITGGPSPYIRAAVLGHQRCLQLLRSYGGAVDEDDSKASSEQVISNTTADATLGVASQTSQDGHPLIDNAVPLASSKGESMEVQRHMFINGRAILHYCKPHISAILLEQCNNNIVLSSSSVHVFSCPSRRALIP